MVIICLFEEVCCGVVGGRRSNWPTLGFEGNGVNPGVLWIGMLSCGIEYAVGGWECGILCMRSFPGRKTSMNRISRIVKEKSE